MRRPGLRLPRPSGAVPALVVCTLTLAVVTGVAWTRTSGAGDSTPISSGGQPVMQAEDLFQAKGCASCHNGPASISSGVGPNLANVAAVAASRQPGVSARDYVRRSITSPDSFVVAGFPGVGMGAMPTLAVSPAEVDALVEYLLSTHTP